MLYAICSTAKEDVARCVAEMVARGCKIPVFQFGTKKYRALKKDHSGVEESCKRAEKKAIYAINLDTRKVHKATCHKKGKNVVSARIVSIKSTGLMNCMLCMK